MKSILIVGTGALATLFAARLAASGRHVTMLGSWQAALDNIQHTGARLDQNGQPIRAYPVHATNNPSECQDSDLALVLVKSWQTARAARQLAQCLPEAALALTLQNGLGNREILAASLGEERVILGVTTTGASLLEPGLVRAGGEGLNSLEAHPRVNEFIEIMQTAGLQVEIVPDAKSLMWGKLVISAAINPLTALLRVPNGILLERPSVRQLMFALAQETAAIAMAHGIHLPFANPQNAVETVVRNTAANRSSMLQDVQRGAQTEIDAICGAVVRCGEQINLKAPLNQAMWQLISALQDSNSLSTSSNS